MMFVRTGSIVRDLTSSGRDVSFVRGKPTEPHGPEIDSLAIWGLGRWGYFRWTGPELAAGIWGVSRWNSFVWTDSEIPEPDWGGFRWNSMYWGV